MVRRDSSVVLLQGVRERRRTCRSARRFRSAHGPSVASALEQRGFEWGDLVLVNINGRAADELGADNERVASGNVDAIQAIA